jgi:hypothetical protein
LITHYQISAALWVVRAMDANGVSTTELDAAFHGAVTQGRFPRPDLFNAHQLLLSRGLLEIIDARTVPQKPILVIQKLADSEAIPLLAHLLMSVDDLETDDVERREEVGALGEEAVVAWCVDELKELGREDLAAQVQRVSLVSDHFGYDVSAPTLLDEGRMLEVKATTSTSTFRFFLTRNEYEVGRRNAQRWALVACRVVGNQATVIGWCRVSELERYIPDDANGRWTEALVYLPRYALLAGAPSAIP